jgi:NADP-dependent 3-hydroxy acid dehydrogenase YdfG
MGCVHLFKGKGQAMKNFKNKVAAVTGAGSGIGQQLAVLLAKEGCHLSLSDINEQGLAATVELLKPYNIRVTTQKLDVSDRHAVKAWAEETVQNHGSVNMIFNNAGVALGSTVEGASYEELEWIVNINFWGVVYGTKEFLPLSNKAKMDISSIFPVCLVSLRSLLSRHTTQPNLRYVVLLNLYVKNWICKTVG